jgi:transposase
LAHGGPGETTLPARAGRFRSRRPATRALLVRRTRHALRHNYDCRSCGAAPRAAAASHAARPGADRGAAAAHGAAPLLNWRTKR